MAIPASSTSNRAKSSTGSLGINISPEHYIRLILHRKWLVIGAFLIVTGATMLVTWQLPNIYASDTLILVDPQKVPESYVKSTVTGDVRNRLSTLTTQILSATRLQKIIDNLGLYPTERKNGMAREDVISKMRSDIGVRTEADFGGSQDLQAFRISYSGRDPVLVAKVTQELADLFIDENMKAREQQASGTTDFLTNQLQETRRHLEEQESKLKEFRLAHIGEMPEQQTADLEILGNLENQLRMEEEALNRTQTERGMTLAMMNSSESAGVVDVDDGGSGKPAGGSPDASQSAPKGAGGPTLSAKEKQLAAELAKGHKEDHPDVKKLRKEIEAEKAVQPQDTRPATVQVAQTTPAPEVPVPSPPPPARPSVAARPRSLNPILVTKLNSEDGEIAKHKEKIQTLTGQVAIYHKKIEAIPVREQEIADLVRDYDISKAHYSQLLNNQMQAETASQLEIRQKGEKFQILDPAQPAEKPSKPKRALLNAGGSVAGLALGLMLALATEFLGMSITSPDQITAFSGFQVLEVIPTIQTRADRVQRRRRMFLAALSGVAAALVAVAIVLYHFRTNFF